MVRVVMIGPVKCVVVVVWVVMFGPNQFCKRELMGSFASCCVSYKSQIES